MDVIVWESTTPTPTRLGRIPRVPLGGDAGSRVTDDEIHKITCENSARFFG